MNDGDGADGTAAEGGHMLVVVATDSSVFSDALRACSTEHQVEVAAVSHDVPGLLDHVASCLPDVVVIDWGLGASTVALLGDPPPELLAALERAAASAG
jgi:hypothetical protein